MEDIVAKLRDPGAQQYDYDGNKASKLLFEAANEIELLRSITLACSKRNGDLLAALQRISGLIDSEADDPLDEAISIAVKAVEGIESR